MPAPPRLDPAGLPPPPHRSASSVAGRLRLHLTAHCRCPTNHREPATPLSLACALAPPVAARRPRRLPALRARSSPRPPHACAPYTLIVASSCRSARPTRATAPSVPPPLATLGASSRAHAHAFPSPASPLSLPCATAVASAPLPTGPRARRLTLPSYSRADRARRRRADRLHRACPSARPHSSAASCCRRGHPSAASPCPALLPTPAMALPCPPAPLLRRLAGFVRSWACARSGGAPVSPAPVTRIGPLGE
nr:vegetative cell wall protein gp1-like [Aegilops tauschii subsp. strangulata]